MMNDWISVKERLPEQPHLDVLITDGKRISIGHIGNDNTAWFDYFGCFHHAHIHHEDISHWMPLPDAPK